MRSSSGSIEGPATDGTMPGSAWTLLRPEARLSAHDIETLCIAARQAH